MPADQETQAFADSIGATAPSDSSANYAEWKFLFKRANYFRFNGRFLIAKISRSEKPFWGVGKQYIDLLNSQDDYYLVLLTSARDGWVFNKSGVNGFISSGRWKLRNEDMNYKINSPLPDAHAFSSPSRFHVLAWNNEKAT